MGLVSVVALTDEQHFEDQTVQLSLTQSCCAVELSGIFDVIMYQKNSVRYHLITVTFYEPSLLVFFVLKI